MDTITALLTRRSIRKFTDKSVAKKDIETILEAAMYAPSACNKQPWHFVVIDSKEIMNEIPKFMPNASLIKTAACAILVCGDENLAHDKIYWPVDCSAATQNILLAAHELGLGACWCGIYPRTERIASMKQLMNLPDGIHAFSLIAIGYAVENLPKPQRAAASRVRWNKW
jgi:nitroreductase